MRLLAFFLLSIGLLPLPVAAQQKPEEFAWRQTVQAENVAPYYRLTVPLETYLQSAHGDLRDLRVFNSAGQPVPYARLAASSQTRETMRRFKLSWFPLLTDSEGGEDNPAANNSSLKVSVRQSADGTLVEVNSSESTKATPSLPQSLLRGYILDASRIADRQAIRSIELDWAEGSGSFHLIDIESSDDLRNWQSLRRNVQLARLDYSGARIENRRVDIGGFRDRYLRLMWREPAKAPQLTLAEVEQMATYVESPPLVWSAKMTANRSGEAALAGEYRFHLPQALPLARLRFELPAGNALMPLTVLQSGRQPRQLFPIADSVVYRIVDKGREWMRDEILLDGVPIQDFVVRIDPRGGLPQNLTLSFALEPAQVVFLASGNPPYTLCVGNAKATDSALAPSTLIPGYGGPGGMQIANARLQPIGQSPTAGVNPSVTMQTTLEEGRWKKYALWAVLVAGVIGMLFMAWQLLRQMRQPDNRP